MLIVEACGMLATVQDRGRVGLAHLGVPRAGALDAPAAALADRLVGNDLDCAVIEATLGGLVATNVGPGRWAAVTGAPAPLLLDRRAMPFAEPFWWPSGARLEIGVPNVGVRSYLAVAGGIAVEPVLGSRSTDRLAGVGPAPLSAGQRLPLGATVGVPAEPAVVRRVPGALRVVPGPRSDWFGEAAHRLLLTSVWEVRQESDRIGVRLSGPAVERLPAYVGRELPSEPMVLGAIQVPPQGQPIVFLADHPPTGGYPVIGVVDPDDLWQCAQVRPGDRLLFRAGSG